MPDSLAGVVLGAGAGERLRPLTWYRPKVLCPVAGLPLVDHALDRVAAVVGAGTDRLAVNAHDRPERFEAHLAGRAHVSVERGEALGTAGGVAHLRGWLDGRPALVVNGDTWTTVELGPLVDDWDGSRVRVLLAEPVAELRPGVRVLGSLLPAHVVATLPHRPAGLYEACWRPLLARGEVEVVGAEGPFASCDTPRRYLAANLAASGGASVVGEGALVAGALVRSVVWPGGVVRAGETLVDAIRIGERTTVLVR
jgi:NDP-sugar pyrophosphorylase family protein